jgi:hypothetical protein
MREIRLRSRVSDDTLPGKLLDDSDVDLVVCESADVYKPDGTILARFRKGLMSASETRKAYHGLKGAAYRSDQTNRGIAGGSRNDFQDRNVTYVRLDGSKSNTSRAATGSTSGIVGFYDREARRPFCRTTAYTAKHPEKFSAAMPYFRTIDGHFRDLAPERWEAQRGVCDDTEPEWVIPGTVFTTVTVNKNFQTAVHKDNGDFPEGFGVMTAFSAGTYEGFHLAFPGFDPVVAFDMRTRDLLLADVHEWHGNTTPHGTPPWERISLVCYYREKMHLCKDMESELEWAKRRERGETMTG